MGLQTGLDCPSGRLSLRGLLPRPRRAAATGILTLNPPCASA